MSHWASYTHFSQADLLHCSGIIEPPLGPIYHVKKLLRLPEGERASNKCSMYLVFGYSADTDLKWLIKFWHGQKNPKEVIHLVPSLEEKWKIGITGEVRLQVVWGLWASFSCLAGVGITWCHWWALACIAWSDLCFYQASSRLLPLKRTACVFCWDLPLCIVTQQLGLLQLRSGFPKPHRKIKASTIWSDGSRALVGPSSVWLVSADLTSNVIIVCARQLAPFWKWIELLCYT